MNFLFRLGLHPRDTSLYVCKHSKKIKNPKHFHSQPFWIKDTQAVIELLLIQWILFNFNGHLQFKMAEPTYMPPIMCEFQLLHVVTNTLNKLYSTW